MLAMDLEGKKGSSPSGLPTDERPSCPPSGAGAIRSKQSLSAVSQDVGPQWKNRVAPSFAGKGGDGNGPSPPRCHLS